MSASTELINLNMSLLEPAPHNPDVCANHRNLADLDFDLIFCVKPSNHSFLGRIQHLCLNARIKNCSNRQCVDLCKQVSPTVDCNWPTFREWICVVASCHLRTLLIQTQRWLLNALRETVGEPLTEIKFQVCEMFNWLSYAMDCTPALIDSHVSTELVLNSLETARGLKICENRLWNLTMGVAGEKHIPSLIHLATGGQSSSPTSHIRFQHPHHDACTAEFCYFSDFDSTNVEQLHKCVRRDCGLLRFVLEQRNADDEPFNLWWQGDKGTSPYLIKKPSAIGDTVFMAISHVWSDGTGAGFNQAGSVNSCLFDYFKTVAKMLGCEGIWWDTVSIPRDRKARNKAMGNINHYFRSAKCTLVHDEYLVNFPWAEDGTPCLAIVLSPWFSRAWTALELFSSRDVWVIFKDPEAGEGPVLKNLKRDILAGARLSCSYGHFMASAIIETLCRPLSRGISDVLRVLRARSTSKPRDLIIIAGLLAGRQPSISSRMVDSPAETTKAIILSMRYIESGFLFHGHVTMTQKGGFSWCPFNLLHGPDLHAYGSCERDAPVDDDGSILARFRFRILQSDDHLRLRPYSFHRSVDYKILAVLAEPGIALLLWHDKLESSHALLVRPFRVANLEIGQGYTFVEQLFVNSVDSHYVGTVDTDLKPHSARKLFVRLGHVVDTHPDITAEQIMENSFLGLGIGDEQMKYPSRADRHGPEDLDFPLAWFN